MNNSCVKFYSLNIVVSDLKTSIEFYKKMGFYISESKANNYAVSTYMKLSEDSDFMICLTQTLDDKKTKCDKIWIEMEPKVIHDEAIDLYGDSFQQLLDKGINYENLEPEERGKIICSTAVMQDPDGFIWHLVDNFEYE